MPALMFALENKSQWVVGTANSGIQYYVRGPTMQLQQSNLQALVNEMEQGAQAFDINSLNGMLYLNGADPNEVYVGLFEETDQIIVNGNVVFACYEPDEFLDDVFAEAAEALAAALL